MRRWWRAAWGGAAWWAAGSWQINESAGYCRIGEQEVRAGDFLTIDGSTGQVILGQAPLVEADLGGDFAQLMEWADSYRTLGRAL